MLSSRIELETLAVLKPCDNQLHHESQFDGDHRKIGVCNQHFDNAAVSWCSNQRCPGSCLLHFTARQNLRQRSTACFHNADVQTFSAVWTGGGHAVILSLGQLPLGIPVLALAELW